MSPRHGPRMLCPLSFVLGRKTSTLAFRPLERPNVLLTSLRIICYLKQLVLDWRHIWKLPLLPQHAVCAQLGRAADPPLSSSAGNREERTAVLHWNAVERAAQGCRAVLWSRKQHH